jgi:hypothetical protein
MRTIKFKGLRVDGKGWVCGHYYDDEIQSFIISGINTYEVIPELVGQFTGLIDIEGKEIYEGDYVQSPWHYTKDKIVSLAIEDGFCYAVLEYSLENVLKITGNIHEK